MGLMKRLGGLLRRGRMERELEEELRSHVAMRSDDNLAGGMSKEEAERDARRRFGNMPLAKEDTREMDLIMWLETVRQNLAYGWRVLRRNPGFTIVAVLTLALGIGANIATFSVVHAVVLRPLPYPEPERLVRVFDDLQGADTKDVGMSVPELWDLQRGSGVFEDVSFIWPISENLTGGEHPQRTESVATSANYFTMLGAHAQLGRLYEPQDAVPGFTDGVVISDGFWKRVFGGRPDVIGTRVRLDSDLYTIMGVLPPDFRHPGRTLETEMDVWSASGLTGPPFPPTPQRAQRILPGGIARLKRGLTLEQAQTKLDAFTAHLQQQYPNEYPAAAGWAVRVVPIQADLVGKARTELLVLFGAVGCVMLITCVNLANLQLARSAGRQREIAVRLAVGAGRGRLLGQLLTESILLAVISGGVALLLVVWMKDWLVRLAPASLPRLNEVAISPGVMLFAFGLSVVTGVLFGLVPAIQSSGTDQVMSLREGSRGSGASKKQMRISRTLVTAEIAMSLVLLTGAGLLLKSFWHLLEVHPGFESHHIVTTKLWLPVQNDRETDPYRPVPVRAAFLKEVLRRVRQLPGVEEAAIGGDSSVPLGNARFLAPFDVENRANESEREPVAEFANVSPEFFGVLRIRLMEGRTFREDDDPKGQPVAIVNETLAHRYWPNGEAVGQRIRFGTRQTQNKWITIVGVTEDVKTHGFDVANAPQVYQPAYQQPGYGSVVYARTITEPGQLAELIRREVQNVNPDIPVYGVRTLDDVVAQSLAQRRFALELLGIFAGVAVVLASIGIYGVMAYTFSQRTNEIGIRMAMGASRADILRMVVNEGSTLVGMGLAGGLIGSIVVTRFLQSMLFEVNATDPLTFAAVTVSLAGVALAACVIPARRATRVEPLTALRYE